MDGNCPACERTGVRLVKSPYLEADAPLVCLGCNQAAKEGQEGEAGKAAKEKKMPKNTHAPVGTCPRCNKPDLKLRESKHLPGERVCSSCISIAIYHANRKAAGKLPRPIGTKSKAKSAPPASAAKSPGAAAEHRPVTFGRPELFRPLPVPTAVATGHSNGRAVVLRVTCHEYADVTRFLAAAAGLSCAIGLEDAP